MSEVQLLGSFNSRGVRWTFDFAKP